MIYPEDVPPSVISAAEVLLRAIDATGAVPVPDGPLEERAKAVAAVVVAMYDADTEIEIRERTDGPARGFRLVAEDPDDLLHEMRIAAFLERADAYAAKLVATGHCPIHLIKNCECRR